MKYHGEIPEGHVVHHKNGNKLDWSIENLELILRSEHIKRHKNIVKRPGIKVVARKDGIKIIFGTLEEAAKFCGTHPCLIRRVFEGKQKQSNGWAFERGNAENVTDIL